jgi:hypothetical protein
MYATKHNQAWTTALLNDCHGMALTHLRPYLDKLFMNSDLALLEFAEKAQTEASQIRFMEAMSVIQKNRAHIEEVFLREVRKGFTEFGSPAMHGPRTAGSIYEPLTLVSKQDTDIQVAIQNMVSSAALGSTLTLSALRKRLAVLNNGRMPEDTQIPAGPHNLANAFHQGVKDIDLDHETRLIVYLLFDKFVLDNTRPLYDKYNQHLVKSGILPHLRYEVRKYPINTPVHQGVRQSGTGGATVRQHTGVPASHTGNQHSLADELFSDILELLSQHTRTTHTTAHAQETEKGNRQGGNSGSVNTAHSPIEPQELVTIIHNLQNNRITDTSAVASTVPGAYNPEQQTQLVSTMIEQLGAEREQLLRGTERRKMPSADTQIIDLVGMMFEYMLRDKNIPSIAKAELSRLHTPYLKVAILDKGVFSNTTHPAHVLLNRLASAAAHWVFEDNLERGVFPCLRNIVQRIIEEFENSLDIFPELLDVLDATLRSLDDKAVAIEERSRQAAKGKERLGMARAWATKAVEERVSGHRIPVRLRDLLVDTWIDKLTFIYLREPDSEESTSWRLATQAIEAIIWTVEPRNTDEEREELRKRLPDLRKQIKLSLETLSVYGNNDNEAQLTLIRELQNEATLKTEQPAESGPDEDETQDAPPPAPVASENTESGVDKTAIHDEIIDDLEARLTPEEEAALSELEQVGFGAWFIIQENEAFPPQKVKLSWYSSISGKYMFVDSMGVRVMMRKHHELATLLATGKARIIDSEQQPFMHRAMEKIRCILGGDKTAQA